MPAPHMMQNKELPQKTLHPSNQSPPSGLTQYSGDPQTEWDLNSFHTKEQVLAAIHSLRYKGGNTFTGMSWPEGWLF